MVLVNDCHSDVTPVNNSDSDRRIVLELGFLCLITVLTFYYAVKFQIIHFRIRF